MHSPLQQLLIEGFLPLSGTDASGDPFGLNTATRLVGAKFDYSGVNGTVAFFDASKSNMLVADPVNVGFSAPIGEADSKGFYFRFKHLYY
ncbi:hypothetical protein ACOBV9_22215 (plasmid) [Pseudoalteromonas espejiana]